MSDIGVIIRDSIWNMYETEIHESHAFPSVTRGEFGSSILITPFADGVQVSAQARHGRFLEEGTSPHFPPLDVIEQWASAKGLDIQDEDEVYLIARHIALSGTPARHFVRRAFTPTVRFRINDTIEAAIAELAFAMGFVDASGFATAASGRRYYAVRGPGGRFVKRS